MKLKKLAALTVFVAALSSAATAKTVSLNLNDLALGETLDNQFSDLGVTFQNAEIAPGDEGNRFNYEPNPYKADPNNPIRALFSTAVESVSVKSFNVGPNGFLLRAYDALVGGNLVDSQQIEFSFSNQKDLFLTVTGGSIFRVEVSQIRNLYSDNASYGNFTFSTDGIAPVPLPASLPLLAGAIGGFSLLRRRRARA